MKSSYIKKNLIDLDGVLNVYEGGFNENKIPAIKNGAKEFLEKLSKKNELYLFTTRNLLLAAKWLIENKIDCFFKDITSVKLPSYLYIDDRAICFKGDFDKTIKEIEDFKVYWK